MQLPASHRSKYAIPASNHVVTAAITAELMHDAKKTKQRN